MIRHVVLWRLKSHNGDSFHAIKVALQAQQGRIPGLLRVEVGRNFATSRRAVMQTRAVVDPLVAEHWIVDYEL